jgi:rRNA biogenesis protein RRP5
VPATPPLPQGNGSKKKRITLSLHVSRTNSGMGMLGLAEGAVLPAVVKSVEDHGYVLTLGIKVLQVP